MKKLNIILTSILIAFSTTSAEDRTETPQVVTSALEAYQESGIEAFVDRFVKGSMVGNEPSKVNGMKGKFLAYSSQLGAFDSYEVIMNQKVTNKITRTFFAIHYEVGVLFCRMDTYTQPSGDSVILMGSWDTNSWDIYPWKATAEDTATDSRYENLLKRWEEQADRFDKVLDLWEQKPTISNQSH
ncbi:MAG: hypothetical protein AAF546_09375 [Verrucomicrobiota bacterium]